MQYDEHRENFCEFPRSARFEAEILWKIIRTTMKEDYEIEEKKQAAADVLFQYSQFMMACIGNQVRPCDLRLHLMKEISGLSTSLKELSQRADNSSQITDEYIVQHALVSLKFKS